MIRDIFKRIKMVLWQIGLWKNCPMCGEKLEEIGHAKDEGWQDYRCTGVHCDFGKCTE